MKENDFVLTTWALTRKQAIRRLEDEAHYNFKKHLEAFLTKDKNLLSASLNIVEIKRRLFKFDIAYMIEAHFFTKPTCCITKASKPTKKQIKETPKKVYHKRDSKGRFTK